MSAPTEIVVASTILLAERSVPPVSTHILSSGIAGASVPEGDVLQRWTVRSMVLASALTLPAAMWLA